MGGCSNVTRGTGLGVGTWPHLARAVQVSPDSVVWAAMANHRLRLVLAGVCLVASACTSPTTATTSPTTTGTTVPATTAPTSTTLVTPALSPLFLDYRYPVDGPELVLGWETYEEPVQLRYYELIGDCVADGGYDVLGHGIRDATDLGAPRGGWLFPDLAVLRDRGFEWGQTDPALNVVWTAYDPTLDSPGSVKIYLDLLQRNPDLGVPADEQAVGQLNSILWGCVMAASKATWGAGSGVSWISPDWVQTLSDMERTDDQVWFADTNALDCARQIDPVFASVSSLVEWFATLDGVSASMDDLDEAQTKRREWGQAYATCVERLVQVRTEKRLALRDKMIREQLPQLADQQAALDAWFEEVTRTPQEGL